MKIYLKALLKCKVPVQIDDFWLSPLKIATKVGLGRQFSLWFLHSYKAHDEWNKSMKNQARIFIGYDGALECPGRDTDEFLYQVTRGMDEMALYFMDIISPRVQMAIAFGDPEEYPYHYVKWTTLLNIFKVRAHLAKHKNWIIATVALLATNILTLL